MVWRWRTEAARALQMRVIVVRGLVNRKGPAGGFISPVDTTVKIDGSSWVAVRCFEKHPRGRVRFAHSSPVHIEVPGKPLRARRERVAYLVRRMEEELARNQGVLKPSEVDEYRKALSVYRRIAERAR